MLNPETDMTQEDVKKALDAKQKEEDGKVYHFTTVDVIFSNFWALFPGFYSIFY